MIYLHVISCPCCKGKRFLPVVRADLPGAPTKYETCSHCIGTGQSEAEEFAPPQRRRRGKRAGQIGEE